MEFKSVDEILDYAIGQEEEAARFYMGLAEKVKRGNMKETFLSFAEEEKGHKAKLEKIKSGKLLLTDETKVLDLKIAEQVGDVDISESLDYQEALIIAMKAEKAAFKMYSDLAGATDDPELEVMLLGLAQEEAKHKLRFEIEYDDVVLKED